MCECDNYTPKEGKAFYSYRERAEHWKQNLKNKAFKELENAINHEGRGEA